MDILGSLVKSSAVGNLNNFAKSAFDFFQGKEPSEVIPQHPVLSSQYELKFYIGNSQEAVHIFDIDNITKTLITSEKKSFRPYGFTHKVNLINYEGWAIKITGKKTNPALNYLIQKIYESASYPSFQSPNLAIARQKIVMPMFRMVETIKSNPAQDYSPRTIEEYEYENMIIDGYDEEVTGDNMPLSFTLSLIARSRKTISFEDDESGVINQQINDLLDYLSRGNRQIL